MTPWTGPSYDVKQIFHIIQPRMVHWVQLLLSDTRAYTVVYGHVLLKAQIWQAGVR
jgi:hypothetical protein